MATVKKMARVVILSRLRVPLAKISVFEDVASMADSDLLVEYDKIVARKTATINAEKAAAQEEINQLTAEETELA